MSLMYVLSGAVWCGCAQLWGATLFKTMVRGAAPMILNRAQGICQGDNPKPSNIPIAEL